MCVYNIERLSDPFLQWRAAGHNVAFIHPKGNEQFPLSGEGVRVVCIHMSREVMVNAFRS